MMLSLEGRMVPREAIYRVSRRVTRGQRKLLLVLYSSRWPHREFDISRRTEAQVYFVTAMEARLSVVHWLRVEGGP